MNEDGQCFPDKPCPTGFEKRDEDETGRCYPINLSESDELTETETTKKPPAWIYDYIPIMGDSTCFFFNDYSGPLATLRPADVQTVLVFWIGQVVSY